MVNLSAASWFQSVTRVSSACAITASSTVELAALTKSRSTTAALQCRQLIELIAEQLVNVGDNVRFVAVRVESRQSGEQLQKDYAVAEGVDLDGDVAAKGLRRHVHTGADDGAGDHRGAGVRGGALADEAQVAEAGAQAVVEEDVGALDVPVDAGPVVGVAKEANQVGVLQAVHGGQLGDELACFGVFLLLFSRRLQTGQLLEALHGDVLQAGQFRRAVEVSRGAAKDLAERALAHFGASFADVRRGKVLRGALKVAVGKSNRRLLTADAGPHQIGRPVQGTRLQKVDRLCDRMPPSAIGAPVLEQGAGGAAARSLSLLFQQGNVGGLQQQLAGAVRADQLVAVGGRQVTQFTLQADHPVHLQDHGS
ncbi:hypothetical protein TYRP_008849 [Tyrophagus putrescentiae]|nr:hypothetical protein TYRP_008849 [Tyrophagus putrescentiae]